ncbi:MAG TPA: aspartate kinase [Woeseiaceae bacterium]|nr:aspartate kinase [Woeseiaceae bacterium]
MTREVERQDVQQRATHTVEKIGGTSMSDARSVLGNIFLGRRSGAELYNRIFIVSAYSGITDKLLEDKKTGEPGVHALFAGSESEWAWGDAISEVSSDMRAINARIFADHPDRQVADRFVRERIEGVRSCLIDLHRLCSYGHFSLSEHLDTVREMLAAVGEAHSAHNSTLLLKQHDVNAVFVDLTGWREEANWSFDNRIARALSDIDLSNTLPVLTGYAHSRAGTIQSYGRGYSEVTLSRVAVLTRAREAVIHKEFHLSSGDPKLIGRERVRKIERTNYDVADQLSNMGMEAIHPRAAKGLRQANIPLRIRNTFDPNDNGSQITGDYVSGIPQAEIITGMRSVIALEFFEQDMVGVKGYDAAILETLKRHSVRVVTKTSNANTIVHYLAGSLKAVHRVVNDLRESFGSARVTTRKVAIVSAIGSDLDVTGLTALAVGALAKAGVEVLGLHQLIRNVDILFVLAEEDYDEAMIALHGALIERAGQQSKQASGSSASRPQRAA